MAIQSTCALCHVSGTHPSSKHITSLAHRHRTDTYTDIYIPVQPSNTAHAAHQGWLAGWLHPHTPHISTQTPRTPHTALHAQPARTGEGGTPP